MDRWEVLLFIKLLQKHVQQGIVVGRIHEAETDVFIIQKWESRAVADHQTFPDRCLKEIHGGDIIPQNLHKNEVSVRRIIFYGRTGVQNPADPFPF